MKQRAGKFIAQTIGRSWDGGLQVYNHPLPRAWSVLAVLAGLAALTYWLLYPSWPYPGGHFGGLASLELSDAEGDRRLRWSSANALQVEQEQAALTPHRGRLQRGFHRADYAVAVADHAMRQFALATARAPYLDYCAGCHGSDGQGIAAVGPPLNTVTGDGPNFAGIESAIRPGGVASAHGVMRLSALQTKALTVYVQQLRASSSASSRQSELAVKSPG